MVTRLRAGWPRNSGLIPHISNRCFSSWNHPHWPWSPPRLLFSGCWGAPSWGSETASVCEAGHSPPSSAKLNKECNYTSVPAKDLMMWTWTT